MVRPHGGIPHPIYLVSVEAANLPDDKRVQLGTRVEIAPVEVIETVYRTQL